TIPAMRERFQCHVGLSDHTLGIGVAVAATALGAAVIERHLTLSRTDGSVDSGFSMEPQELKQLVHETAAAHAAVGQERYGPSEREKSSLIFRRSLYITRDLEAGELLSPENLRSIRPGLGLPPKFYDDLLGKRVKRKVAKGTPAQWDLLESKG